MFRFNCAQKNCVPKVPLHNIREHTELSAVT